MLHSRMKRVEEEYQHELARILAYELEDPRLKFATVTSVSIGRDLSDATVYISFLEDDPEKEREAMHAIEVARGLIKRLLAERLVLKRHPNPHFRLDTTQRDAFRLFKIMEENRPADLPEESATQASESPSSTGAPESPSSTGASESLSSTESASSTEAPESPSSTETPRSLSSTATPESSIEAPSQDSTEEQ
jgi:ribosome-binding factor A